MSIKPVYELIGQPKLLIVDGAGTLFDPGSIVPVYGFQSGFKEYTPKDSNKKFGFEPDFDLVRKYMGRNKLEHVKLLLQEPVVRQAFLERYGKEPTNEDAEGIYFSFKEQLYPAAAKTEEIPRVKEATYTSREAGIPLIMTTGYDRRMVDETKKVLPWLDDVLKASFTSSDVKKGRPYPFMLYRAMESEDVINPAYAIKAGDTKVDMEASDNACMPGIIVLSGSIKNKKEAEQINEEIGRRHLVLSSLVDVINYTLDGTLVDRIKELNKQTYPYYSANIPHDFL